MGQQSPDSRAHKKNHTARRHPCHGIGRSAAGRKPVWDTATVIYMFVCVKVSRRSLGALQKSPGHMRARAQHKGKDQLAATASAARGPEPSSCRSLGAPCSMRRLLPPPPTPPLVAPAPSIIERKFLTTRAGGGAAAACWSADASCSSSDAVSASFSCDWSLVSEMGRAERNAKKKFEQFIHAVQR